MVYSCLLTKIPLSKSLGFSLLNLILLSLFLPTSLLKVQCSCSFCLGKLFILIFHGFSGIFLASLLLYFSFKHWYLLAVAYMLRPLFFLIYTLSMKGLLYFAGFNYDLHDGESQIHITCRYLSWTFALTVSRHLKPNLVRKLESLLNVVFFYVASCSMDQQISSHPRETGT